MRVLQNCDRCSGSHSIEGCPQPKLEVPEIFELYWPPDPNPDSWTSDTPNEGIGYEKNSDGEAICSYGADYHGFYLLTPGASRIEFEIPTDAGREVVYFGEQDPQYIVAYSMIRNALFSGVNVSIQELVRSVMNKLGWKLVETCEIVTEESTTYFKWK